MFLTKVRIRNFRNFDDFTVKLEEFSVIIGANNVGKTNFLDALSCVFSFTSARNVQISNQDFLDPAKPIVIDVIFSELTEHDKAAFFHQDGIINPETDTIFIRFESSWSNNEQDVYNECYFLRDDRDNNLRITDFTRRFKEYTPFFAIPASRFANQEIGISRQNDFGQVMRIYADDYLKPLAALRHDMYESLKASEEEILLWKDQWDDFPDDEFGQIRDLINDLLDLTQDGIDKDVNEFRDQLLVKEKSLDTISKSFNKNLDERQDESDPHTIISRSTNQLLIKARTFLKRCQAQGVLQNLRDDMLSNQQFSQLNSELENIFDEILPNQEVHLNLFPIQDDELISRVSVDIDQFPLLRQGSGYQSVFVIGIKLMRTLAQLLQSKTMDIRNFILAVEEPESHLHPHMQRHLVKSLRRIQEYWNKKGYSLQLIATTHSPSILTQIFPHELVSFQKEADRPKMVKWGEDELQKIVEELEPNVENQGKKYRQLKKWTEFFFERNAEVFFCNCVIVVEGETEEGAIPVWANKLEPPADFDQLGISIVNAKGSSITYALKILDKFGLDHVCLYDQGDGHDVSVSSGGFHSTNGNEFEDDVMTSVSVINILKALSMVSSDSSTTNRIDWIRGNINGCENIYNLESLIEALKQESIDQVGKDKIRDQARKWIKNKNTKSLYFGIALAKTTFTKEIPKVCRDLIEDASQRARSKMEN